MRSIVKVSWSGEVPELNLAKENGYERMELGEGKELEYEISDNRRCVGYHSDRGEMQPCPEFREIKSGDQCGECRKKDIYTGWRKGDGTPDFEADYSVYLAQCGSEVKVGVTRSNRLRNRWLEQGADYGVELYSDLSDKEALQKEKELSDKGLRERIRKEEKIGKYSSYPIKKKLEELEMREKAIKNISEPVEAKEVVRKGRSPSPIKTVKGQIVSNGRVAMILSSGKLLEKPEQQELRSF